MTDAVTAANGAKSIMPEAIPSAASVPIAPIEMPSDCPIDEPK